MIWLHTMKHTGTHFTMRHLELLGLKQQIDFIHGHVEEWRDELDNTARTDKFITTLRNPINIWRSYGTRYKWHVDEIERKILYAFDRWEITRRRFNSFIFKIDLGEVEDRYFALCDYLGVPGDYVEVPRDSKVNVISRHHIDFKIDPPQSIIELSKRYYYERKNVKNC